MTEERNIGEEILEGIRQIKRGELGRVTYHPPIHEIRERAGLSEARFAELLGVSERTVKDWEQGRRVPTGAAWTLLRVAGRRPEVLQELV